MAARVSRRGRLLEGRAMRLDDRNRCGAGVALVLALLVTGCMPKSSRRSLGRTQGVTAAAGALRADGDGWIVFVGADDPAKEGDEGLYEMRVVSNGSLLKPARIGEEASAIALQFAASDGEEARAAWLVEDLAGSGRGRLHAASRGGDGTWGAVEPLDEGSVAAGAFDLASDGAGRAVLVWEVDGSIVASVAEPGLPFSTPVVLFAAADPLLADSPRVALGGSGRGVVACHFGSPPDERGVLGWAFDAASGFAPLGRIDDAPFEITEMAAVAAAADGSAAIAWNEDPSSGQGGILVRRVDAGGALLPVDRTVVQQFEPHRIALRFGDDGALYLGWLYPSDVSWIRSPAPGLIDPVARTSVNGQLDQFGFVVGAGGRITTVAAIVVGSNLDVHGARHQGGVANHSIRSLVPDVASGSPPVGLTLLEGGALTLAFWIVDETLETHVWIDPIAAFKTRPMSPEAGERVVLDAKESSANSTGTALSKYHWDFESDGVVDEESTSPTLDHVFIVGGTYPVSLAVVDDWGDFAVATESVEVSGGDGPPWDLVVERSGNGRVWCDFDGDGVNEIDVPGDGVASFADGEYVFLKPEPQPGYQLVAWEGLDNDSGDGNYGVEGCVVHMIRDRQVKAIFLHP